MWRWCRHSYVQCMQGRWWDTLDTVLQNPVDVCEDLQHEEPDPDDEWKNWNMNDPELEDEDVDEMCWGKKKICVMRLCRATSRWTFSLCAKPEQGTPRVKWKCGGRGKKRVQKRGWGE